MCALPLKSFGENILSILLSYVQLYSLYYKIQIISKQILSAKLTSVAHSHMA
jgi:hypothetical protein